MGFSLQIDKIAKKLIKTIYLALILLSAIPVLAEETEFFPLKEIQVGMKGYGKTVISGRKIEKFDVEILGVVNNNKINESTLINGKSILVKVSGDVIKRAGGIAAGMSGSPVYIDNRLVGGISSGWLMTDHTVGLVTPIEEMLEIWNYPSANDSNENFKTGSIRKWHSDEPIKLGSKTINTIIEVPYGLAEAVVPDKNEAVFAQAAAELKIDSTGSNKVSESLKAKLNRKNIIVSDNNQKISSNENLSNYFAVISPDYYEPGSSIGIQLARGDINVTTLGTLTHRNGEKILGLAHPFLKKGSVEFLLTGAYIHHSFGSVQMPFKIGAPTEMLGTVTQDREKGISGIIGKIPSMIPIKIDVTDKTIGIERSINYQIVKDTSVLATVLDTTIMQALEGAIDREGPGTALMSISVDCSSKSGENFNFRRENLFYSKTDICQVLTNEVTSLIEMITESEFDEVMPTRLLLKVEIERKRRTLTIEKVEIKNSSVSSGGVLDVEITLKPFRETKFIRKVKLPIPQDIGHENLTLVVYGLNNKVEDLDIPVDSRESKGAQIKSDDFSPSDFSSLLRHWSSSPKNSDLLFQLSVDGDDSKKLKLNGNDIEIQPTNFVVTGRVDTTLTLSEE